MRVTKFVKAAEQAVGRLAANLVACALLTVTAAAAEPAAPYPTMAPIEAYLMHPAQEIALAKSAAPASISNDASVLVLTRAGYQTAITGTNGFVCWVARGWAGASDWPERWNPKIRGAECQNPAAARTVLPYAKLRTAMLLAGRTTTEIIARISTAARTHEIPPLDSGAMSYMMSKSSYLTGEGDDHDMPHLMFFVATRNAAGWGANAPDSPVLGVDYWFYTPGHEAEAARLPPLSVFLSGVATWSDGTPAQPHRM